MTRSVQFSCIKRRRCWCSTHHWIAYHLLERWETHPSSHFKGCGQFKSYGQLSSVQSLSRVQLFATPWIAACQASLSITNSRSLLRLMSINSVMPSSHLILCRPFLLLPPIPPSIRVFSNESTLCIRWPKYWSFSFGMSPSNEHPGPISFRMDWLDLLAVQGTLKSLLQHHSSKASILRHSAFFKVQLSHPYMTTGKTTVFARGTFVGKVMSLLVNMLSRLVITFLPRSKCLNFMAAITICSDFWAPSPKKVWHCFHCFPIYLPWSDGTRSHDLSFLNGQLMCMKMPSPPTVNTVTEEASITTSWVYCIANFIVHTVEIKNNQMREAKAISSEQRSQPPLLGFGRNSKAGRGVGKLENFTVGKK